MVNLTPEIEPGNPETSPYEPPVILERKMITAELQTGELPAEPPPPF